MKCPKCKSEDIVKGPTVTRNTETNWADGLGSPGTITHYINACFCKKCNHVYERISLENDEQ